MIYAAVKSNRFCFAAEFDSSGCCNAVAWFVSGIYCQWCWQCLTANACVVAETQ